MMNFDHIDPRTVSVIYHADCNDGFGAAYAAWKKFGNAAQYFPMGYGKEPERRLYEDKHVFVVDFSFPRDILEMMKHNARSLVILDHHKTAEEDLRNFPGAIFDQGRSGALITWHYFHGRPGTPRLIQHLSDYDLWQFQMQDTREFKHALDSHPRSFVVWDQIVAGTERTVSDYLAFRDEGRIIKRRHDIIVADIVRGGRPISFMAIDPRTAGKTKEMAVKVHGMGVNCSPMFNSDVGHELAKTPNYDPLGVCWGYDAKINKIVVSLRSVGGFDTTRISRMHGGGGHEAASGFKMTVEQFFAADRF